MGITPYALAKGIFVDPPRIAAIIKGKRKITADTAVRLSRFFGTTPEFWMNMQSRYCSPPGEVSAFKLNLPILVSVD